MTEPVLLDLPFRGRWRVENSPARRIPSHGTWMFGVSHAIDFVAVDDQGRSAPLRWRTLVSSEPPECFLGFGMPVLSPIDGRVVQIHNAAPDHNGRRSQLSLLPYMLGQSRRAREGADAIAANRVVIAPAAHGPFVVLAHLRFGSVSVDLGTRVGTGQQIGECGNSGNSTEPHLHLQVSDSLDWRRARGIPLAFRRRDGTTWVPEESEIVTAETGTD